MGEYVVVNTNPSIVLPEMVVLSEGEVFFDKDTAIQERNRLREEHDNPEIEVYPLGNRV